MEKKILIDDRINRDYNPLEDLIKQHLSLDDFVEEAELRNIKVIKPDDSASTEIRDDYSRFFPVVENGKVTGGKFQ